MRDCSVRVAKRKALISFAVTAYAKSRFSHDAAQTYISRRYLDFFAPFLNQSASKIP